MDLEDIRQNKPILSNVDISLLNTFCLKRVENSHIFNQAQQKKNYLRVIKITINDSIKSICRYQEKHCRIQEKLATKCATKKLQRSTAKPVHSMQAYGFQGIFQFYCNFTVTVYGTDRIEGYSLLRRSLDRARRAFVIHADHFADEMAITKSSFAFLFLGHNISIGLN